MQELTCTYKGEEYSVREDGSVFRHPRPGKKPRPYDSNWTFGNKNLERGYMEIASVQVHRIVATAFHGEAPTSQHVVDHKDTNKCNNRPENLRWVTKFENIMLNPITVKRIEWVIGDKIEKFLEDPSKYKDKFQDQNFAWMRTVTPEEGQHTLERLRDWAKSDKQPAGGSLGEWIYSRGNLYEQQVEDLSAIIPSRTPNASQRNYKMVCDFPFCPPSVEGDPITAYTRRMGPINVFVASDYFISVCYKRTVSVDGSTLFVISESQGRTKYWGLAKITYENGQFVHENLGVFLELQGAERRFSEVQGFEWTGGEQEDEMPEMAEVPDVIPSKTPGAVQKNWKTVSEFPGCPQEQTADPLITYTRHLAPDSVFSLNDYGSSIVRKTQLSQDNKYLYVITDSDSATAVKRWALAQVTYEEGLYVHENLGNFFEERGAERALCEATGGEWKGEEGIDDWA